MPLLVQAVKDAAHKAIDQKGRRAGTPGSLLAPHLPKGVTRDATLIEALGEARAIRHEGRRAELLAILGPLLTEGPARDEAIREALARTQAISSEWERSEVLAGLASCLPEPLLADAFSVARSIGDPALRSRPLSALAAHLPEIRLGEALDVVRSIEAESRRSEALCELAAHCLPECLLGEALVVARSIGKYGAEVRGFGCIGDRFFRSADEGRCRTRGARRGEVNRRRRAESRGTIRISRASA